MASGRHARPNGREGDGGGRPATLADDEGSRRATGRVGRGKLDHGRRVQAVTDDSPKSRDARDPRRQVRGLDRANKKGHPDLGWPYPGYEYTREDSNL